MTGESCRLGRAIGINFLCIFILTSVLTSGCQAASGPSQDLLKNRLAIQLPPYFSVRSFRVEVSENVGTKVEPVIKHRFSAELEALEDTFSPGERQEGALYIMPVCRKGDRKMVYGVSTSVRKASSWEVHYNLEGNTITGLGAPRASFSGQTVIKGSPEENRLVLARTEEEKRRAEQRASIKIPKQGEKSEFDLTVYPDEWSPLIAMPSYYNWSFYVVGQDGLRTLFMPDRDESRVLMLTKGQPFRGFDKTVNAVQFKSAETGPVVVRFKLTPISEK